MTTKEVIQKLQELDPEGEKDVFLTLRLFHDSVYRVNVASTVKVKYTSRKKQYPDKDIVVLANLDYTAKDRQDENHPR